MTSSHRHPSAAFWITVALVAVLVGYPLSFGPACWWFAKESAVWEGCVGSRPKVAPRAYWPIGWLAENGQRPVHDAIFWYATRQNGHVLLPVESSGQKLRSQ